MHLPILQQPIFWGWVPKQHLPPLKVADGPSRSQPLWAPGDTLPECAAQQLPVKTCKRNKLLHEHLLSPISTSCDTRYAANLINFGGPSEELQGERTAQLELQHPQNGHLHVSDLGCGVGLVCDVGKVWDLWGIHLLVLWSKEHGSHSNKLQLLLGDWIVLLGGIVAVSEMKTMKGGLVYCRTNSIC